MTILTIPATIEVAIRKRAYQIDGLPEMPNVTHEHVYAYGWQQLMNDAVAPAEKTWAKNEKPTDEQLEAYTAECEALFEKRLENLRKGVFRASSVRVGDPVEKEAREIARGMIEAALKKAGKKSVEGGLAKAVSALLAGPKGEQIRATARANVELVADLGDVDVDDLEIADDESED